MIEVNLLKEERQRQSRAWEKVDPTKPLLYVAFIAILAAAALLDASLYFKSSGLKIAVKRVQDARKAPQRLEKLAQSDNLQAELDKINRKAVIIDDLITHRIDWSKKLAALRDSLPADIWIESIELEAPKNPKDVVQTLKVEAATLNTDRGFARSAETMESLRNSPDFMAGMTGELEDRQASDEPWDKNLQEGGNLAKNVWRFSFVTRRPIPESERATPAAKPAAAPKPAAPAPKK